MSAQGLDTIAHRAAKSTNDRFPSGVSQAFPRKSAKSRLQEHLQKQGDPLPTYSDTMLEGQAAHTPQWHSQLTTCSLTFVGAGPNKASAQAEAAERALLHLTSALQRRTTESVERYGSVVLEAVSATNDCKEATLRDGAHGATVRPPDTGGQRGLCAAVAHRGAATCVFIDLDNVDFDPQTAQQHLDVAFLLYHSKNGTRTGERFHGLPNCCVWVPDTVVKDAVDHLMTFECGRMVERFAASGVALPRLLIVTADHFGEALARICHGEHLVSARQLAAALV
jgi:hypothetical protein